MNNRDYIHKVLRELIDPTTKQSKDELETRILMEQQDARVAGLARSPASSKFALTPLEISNRCNIDFGPLEDEVELSPVDYSPSSSGSASSVVTISKMLK